MSKKTAKDIGDKTIYPVGTRSTFVSISEWKGTPLVHIRRYRLPTPSSDSSSSGDETSPRYIPTKKGIALTFDEWQDVQGLKDIIHQSLTGIEQDDGPSGKKKKRGKKQ